MDINVNTSTLSNLSESAYAISRDLGNIANTISNIRYSLPDKVKGSSNLNSRLNSASTRISNAKTRIEGIGSFLVYAANSYVNTENSLNRSEPNGSNRAAAGAGVLMTGINAASMRCSLVNVGGTLGMDKGAVYSADPVNMSNGNYVCEKSYFNYDTVIGMNVRMFYNVCDGKYGALGRGWRHNFERQLTIEDDVIRVSNEDGSFVNFKRDSAGVYSPLAGSLGSVSVYSNGYTFLDDEKILHTFDLTGKYLSAETAEGWRIDLHYSNNRLSYISCTDDITLNFRYDMYGRLEEISDQASRVLKFSFEGELLVGITDPCGDEIRCEYDAKSRLVKIIAPNGDLSVQNSFDADSHVVQQLFADSSTVKYDYDSAKRMITMTRQNGSKVNYIHDSLFRNTKTIYPNGEENIEYDENDNRTSYTDRLGRTSKYAYDAKGNLVRIKNANGNDLNISYDEADRPIQLDIDGEILGRAVFDKDGHQYEYIDANGGVSRFKYDLLGRIIEVVHEDGSSTLLTYDGKGNICCVEEPLSGKTKYWYDECRRVSSSEDALGFKTGYEYDAMDRLVKVTAPNGAQRSYAYDNRGNLVRITDYNGASTQIDYNAMNRPIRVIDADGHSTTFEYDLMLNLVKKREADGGTTEYEYDTENRKTLIRYPDGTVEKAEYDAVGNLVKRIAQDGGVYQFTYDKLNRPVTITNPMNGVRKVVYDKLGNETGILYEDGSEERFTYDLLGNRTSHTDQSGYTRHFEYNKLNQLTRISDEEKVLAELFYAPGGKLLREKNISGRELKYFYDAVGNVISLQDNTSGEWNFKYDSMHRVVEVEHVGDRVEKYEYDALGNITAFIAGDGTRNVYEYSNSGDLSSVTDGSGCRTDYKFDPCHRLIQILQHGKADEINAFNANQRRTLTTTYRRDICGRVIEAQESDGEVQKFTYDPCGRLLTKEDAEGFVTKCNYGPMGTIDELIFHSGKSIKCRYDALNRLSQVEDWLGRTTIERDIMGRVTKVVDYAGAEVAYSWGHGDQCTGITAPDGQSTAYVYDELGRLSSTVLGSESVAYGYYPNGTLKERIFSNGLKADYGYNRAGQLNSYSFSRNGEIFERMEYGYDGCGRKTRQLSTRNGEATEYGYKYNRLGFISEIYRNRELEQAFEYDSYGNRTRKWHSGAIETYGYDGNRLLWAKCGDNTRSFSYDKRGNLTSEQLNGMQVLSLHYDDLDRLAGAASAVGKSSYTYNSFGMIDNVCRTVNGTAQQVKYVFDGLEPTNRLLGRCTNGEWESFSWDIQPVLSSAGGRTTSFLGNDGLSFTTVCGDMITYPEYDAFGIPSGQAVKNMPFGFGGYRMDPVTGRYDALWRQYDATTGRFVSKDPVAGRQDIPASLNPFIYCLCDPVNMTDPTGRIAAWLAGGIVGAVVNVGAKFAGDVIHSVKAGKWEGSSWQSYVGAAAGGFVQGTVLVASGGNAALAGAAGAATETALTGGLNMLTGVEGYRKEDGYTVGKLLLDTGVSAAEGAAAGAIFNWSAKYVKIPRITSGRGSYVSVFKQVMTKAERDIIFNITAKTLFKGIVAFGLIKTVDTIVDKAIEEGKNFVEDKIRSIVNKIINDVMSGNTSANASSAISNAASSTKATCSTV